MKPIHEFNDFLKNTNWKSSIVHEKKLFKSWKCSFSLKTCVTKGKCVTQDMSTVFQHVWYGYKTLPTTKLTQRPFPYKLDEFQLKHFQELFVISLFRIYLIKFPSTIIGGFIRVSGKFDCEAVRDNSGHRMINFSKISKESN